MSLQNGGAKPHEQPPDFQLLLQSLQGCIRKDGSVKTDHYLCALSELNSLFRSMGKALSLSLHGVPEAIKSIEIQRVTGARCYYDNLTLMLEFEAQNRLQKGSKKIKSGTDSLLLLHRAFSFMITFLSEVTKAIVTDKPFQAGHRVKIYSDLISSFHPAWVRGTVKVLLLRSPGRQEWNKRLKLFLLNSNQQPVELLKDIVDKATPVVDLTSELFTDILLRGD